MSQDFMRRPRWGARLLSAAALFVAAAFVANSALAAEVGPDAGALKATREKGVNFLRSTQADDGSWTVPNSPGVTGLITASLLDSGLKAEDPTVAKALKHLEAFVQKDGGVYDAKSKHRNYETCISLLAFQKANADGRYDKTVADALKFLRELQWDESEKIEPSNPFYGGAGYGSHERPDLSNTQFFIDALAEAGVKSDDPSMKKALVFVSRSQNLESQYNDTPFASKINDGGFYYTPAAGGTSQLGTLPNGGLRSYGSMTYAGLKSFVYAGLTADDPRVKAADQWIKKFYTVDENPGMGNQGLYYYYHTFSKALDVMKVDIFEDSAGKKHDWRKDLAEKLEKTQADNGSWVNGTARWMEGDPNLATAYSLMALSYCEPKAAK